MNIQLGATYRDRITKFAGVAVGHTNYISGCSQVLLVPGLDEKGQPAESHWFDEQRLERVGDDAIVLENGEAPGCDKPAPKR